MENPKNNDVQKVEGKMQMKKIIAAVIIAVVLAISAGAVPAAVESMSPVCETFLPSLRSYSEAVSGSGSVRYIKQSEITCSLPVVIKKMCVSEGDIVKAGTVVAEIDKESSTALVMSLAQINALNVATSDLQAVASLLPESVVSESEGRVVSASRAGTAVLSGESIAVIAESDSLAVTAAISELDISKIRLGQSAYFELSAYPGEKIPAKVSAISETARNQYSGTVLETVVDILVAPDDPSDDRLKSGFSAEVIIELSEPYDIIVAPYSAIEQDDSGEYVYVYENGGAVRRNIVTGKEFSDGTEIRAGLTSKDIVFQNPREVALHRFIRIK